MSEYRTDRITLVETDDVTLDVIEPYPGKYCLHCGVYNWSKSKFKEYLQEWGGILEELYKSSIDEIYCLIPEEERKVQKFAEMFGFQPEFNIDYETDKGTQGVLVLYSFPVKETIEEAN